MRRESGFFEIFIGHFYFPFVPLCVQCRENCGVTKSVDALIHVQYDIRSINSYCAQFAVVPKKAECPSFLGCEFDWFRLYRLSWIDNSHR